MYTIIIFFIRINSVLTWSKEIVFDYLLSLARYILSCLRPTPELINLTIFRDFFFFHVNPYASGAYGVPWIIFPGIFYYLFFLFFFFVIKHRRNKRRYLYYNILLCTSIFVYVMYVYVKHKAIFSLWKRILRKILPERPYLCV